MNPTPQAVHVGAEIATWLQTTMRAEISVHLEDYIADFVEARYQAELAKRTDEAGPDELAWLAAVPQSLTRQYQIATPAAAERGAMLHAELRIPGDGAYWSIGHYSLPVGADGRVRITDADSLSDFWHPYYNGDFPVPTKAGDALVRRAEPAALSGTGDALEWFVGFGQGVVRSYDDIRADLFNGLDFGTAGGRISTGYAPAQSGLSTPASPQRGVLVTGDAGAKQKVGQQAQEAYDRVRAQSQRRGTTAPPPDRNEPDSRLSYVGRDDETVARDRILNSAEFRGPRDKHAPWYASVQWDPALKESKEGLLIGQVILKEFGLPLYFEMQRKNNGMVDPNRFWQVLTHVMAKNNLIQPVCNHFEESIEVDSHNVCKRTDCKLHPTKRQGPFRSTTPKECVHQNVQYDAKMMRQVLLT